MSKLPHSRLFHGPSKTIVISGPEIQVLDSQSGSVLRSTVNLDNTLRESVTKSGPIRCVSVDNEFAHIVSVGDDKKMKVWETEGLKLLSERELPKKPTDVQFTKDGQTILTSDKFGDIFSYPLHPVLETSEASADRLKFVSHDNPSGGKLILGHTSLLTSFLLTEDEKYIITSDRDEHIRVSWYPQGYNIESYCLGHKKFVCALHIPPKSPSVLISGGGDPVLKVWNWYTGKFLRDIRILEHVEPYIKVKVPKGKKSRWDNEDGDGDSPESGQKHAKRGKKWKGKAKANETGKSEEPETDEVIGVAGQEDVEMTSADKVADEKAQPELETVLAVSKIATVGTSSTSTSDGPASIIFSATGATALFLCPYPSRDGPDTRQSAAEVNITACDLERPILDFIVTEDDSERGALLLVLLDGEWGVSQGEQSVSTKMVRTLRCRNDEFIMSDEEDRSSLVASLNSASVLPSNPAQLTSLELYAALSSLPKNTLTERDPMDRPDPDTLIDDGGNKTGGKQLAKMRTRRALAAALSPETKERGGKKPKTDS
ncbi:WD40 repeat-like protein [Neolentinus lepideus HHB14362 ss-1]|uniref:WD40 repeat-like protein n=1 Tax=Neolentinus lepideus HHB14362 ss-1 TaxID=1314782 RepID=A0A165SJP9_9AGAM|nr:WD40 repeat-like protein [Neolentinus lepideus HHB14362 ss-1]